MSEEFYPEDIEQYNQTLHGFYGEFGSGANAKIFFVQSALKPIDLDKITLISDIPGAEAWSVRDLFQRDVDNDRVTNGLIPYFKDPGKAKFFNPITLTILPLDNETQDVLSELPEVIQKKQKFENRDWEVLEVEGFYRYRYMTSSPQYARIEWNDSKVKIVAIDGQHRLSALKRFKGDLDTQSKTDFMNWSIPVVLFSLRRLQPDNAGGTMLDIIRNIFIYINTQARTPNKARQILLTDESVNAVCTQELLEYSHENDVKKYDSIEKDRVPLLFYDWRGAEADSKRVVSDAAMKNIEEVRDWLEYYLIGADFSPEQKTALGIQPIDTLHQAYADKKLDIAAIKELRIVFRKNVLPGIAHVLENYKPYKNYIAKLREIEKEFTQKSDVARHAFHELRFGTSRAGADIERQVREVYGDILEHILDAKNELPLVLGLDIGMRGVMSAFGELRNTYSKLIGRSSTWEEYAKWFTGCLNKSYDDGWLHSRSGQNNSLLKHVTHDHSDSIINYRLDHVREALGVFFVILLGSYGLSSESDTVLWQKMWDLESERLYGTLLRGYKKEVRILIKDDYPNAGRELNEAVKNEAVRRTDEHMDKIQNYMKEIIT